MRKGGQQTNETAYLEDAGGSVSIIGRDLYGNAIKACDFGCGKHGTVTLDDVGQMHGCMPCVIRAARRQCVRRLIKIEQRASGTSAAEAAWAVKG